MARAASSALPDKSADFPYKNSQKTRYVTKVTVAQKCKPDFRTLIPTQSRFMKVEQKSSFLHYSFCHSFPNWLLAHTILLKDFFL